MTISVAPLSAGDDAGMGDLIRIYQAAIERSEQKPAAALQAMGQNPDYRLFVARDGGEVIGFSIAFVPAGSNIWLLEYMAVADGKRSGGLGATLFGETCRLVDQAAPGRTCVLEVDKPPANAPADDVRRRRLRFYRRNGCHILQSLDYILPLDHAGTPPPMLLMVRGKAAGDEISKETVVGWLRAIYSGVYGVPATDPRLVMMVSLMPPSLSLGDI